MESSNGKDTKETLKKMAQFSISTNQISEIHVENLSKYPFIFFNGVKSVKVDYDLVNQNRIEYDTDPKTLEITYKFDKPDTKNFKIIYSLEIDETQENNSLDKRFDALEKSIQTLFWKGIPIEVNFNGKNVYQSKPNE